MQMLLAILFCLCLMVTAIAQAEGGPERNADTQRIRVERRPDRCSVCGSTGVVPIMYGLPVFTDDLEKAVKEKKIILGGCVVSRDDPKWHCVDCNTNFYPTTPREPITFRATEGQ